MYVPKHFDETDEATLFTLMEQDPFAILVLTLNGRPEVNHVPVMIDRERKTISFHLARANAAWQELEKPLEAGEVREILFIFEGAHAYISPDWYESANQVPTWNYAAVHAYARPRRLSDAQTAQMLDDISAAQENQLLPKKPWTNDKLGEKLFSGLRKGLVGYEADITELQGKWKLSQNKTEADRAGAAAALDQRGRPGDRIVANLMRLVDA